MCYGKAVVSRSVSYGQLFVTPWTAARQASLSFIVSQTSLNPMFIDSVMPSNHLVLCHPLLLLPLIFPSIRLFSNESALRIRWPRYWSFNFSISLSNEYSGSVSFRIDWFHLLAVQGTLKSLLQHHSSKTSILWHSAFFIVQLSHPYVTAGKTIALIIWTFVGKVMSLLFNALSAAAAKSLQSCPTLRPQRQQPTRHPRPWDSPGKNTGVGCHFLLQCMKVKSEREVAQSCPTPSDPMECSLQIGRAHVWTPVTS